MTYELIMMTRNDACLSKRWDVTSSIATRHQACQAECHEHVYQNAAAFAGDSIYASRTLVTRDLI